MKSVAGAGVSSVAARTGTCAAPLEDATRDALVILQLVPGLLATAGVGHRSGRLALKCFEHLLGDASLAAAVVP